MAYDNSTSRRREAGAPDEPGTGSYRLGRFSSGDYRESDEPGYGYRDTGYSGSGYGAARSPRSTAGYGRIEPDYGAASVAPPEPDVLTSQRQSAEDFADAAGAGAAGRADAFDDPEHGEPGRDRMGVHFAWEALLLVGAAGLAYLLYRGDAAALRSPALDTMLISAAALGLLVLGAGLPLRAGAPNLAVGPVALAAAVHYAEQGDRGFVEVAGQLTVVAALGGLALAVLVVGLHVPAWAATLAGAFAAIVFIQFRPGPVAVQGGIDVRPYAIYLFGGFAVLAVTGGILGTIKQVRRGLGRFRPVGDPADRRGTVAALSTGAGLVVSVLLATAGGALMAAGSDAPVQPTTGLEWTGLAVGTALVAGTSAFGRRGGVFGTLFAVLLVTVFLRYEEQQNWHISVFAVGAGLIAVGLVVTRLVETYGRPPGAYVPQEWAGDPPAESAPGGWATRADRSDSWSSTLPAQRADEAPGRWSDSRWGTTTG